MINNINWKFNEINPDIEHELLKNKGARELSIAPSEITMYPKSVIDDP